MASTSSQEDAFPLPARHSWRGIYAVPVPGSAAVDGKSTPVYRCVESEEHHYPREKLVHCLNDSIEINAPFDMLYRSAQLLPESTQYVGEREKTVQSATSIIENRQQGPIDRKLKKAESSTPPYNGCNAGSSLSAVSGISGSQERQSATAASSPASETTYGNFSFFTYKETLNRVLALAWAFHHVVEVPLVTFTDTDGSAATNGSSETNPAGAAAATEGKDGFSESHRMLAIWARNCVGWRLVDFACNAGKIVSIPLYDTLGRDAFIYTLNTTQVQVLCVEGGKLPEIFGFLSELKHSLKAVISFQPVTTEDVKSFAAVKITLYYLNDLIEKGMNKVKERPTLSYDDICTIIFTSGTTDVPKGVVITNGSFVAATAGYCLGNDRMQINPTDSTLSYLPLSHVYQRGVEFMLTYMGLKIGYYSGDLLRIIEDIQLLQPSLFFGVPRVYTRMLDKINSAVKQKGVLSQFLVKKALAWKESNYKRDGSRVTAPLPDLILSKIRATFGGCLRSLCMGSAPMEPQALISLQLLLGAPVCEGWGMTETGIAFLQDFSDNVKGTIGGPLPSIEYKVVSIPESNYFVTDNPPRGELWVRGPSIMKRYFRDKTKTAEALDEDGWLKTGDIVELLPSGAVRIVDRAKNIFKLSQGEYIAPERLENIYVCSPFVEQIFVHGYSHQNWLVSIIIPKEDAVMAWAQQKGKPTASYKELLGDVELKRAVLQSLKATGAGFVHGFEEPKNVLLQSEPFTVENGLLTPTMKTIRKRVEKKYKEQLDALYEELKDKKGVL